MGADVIKVEPPEGESGRRIGPFVDDVPDRDRSLFFWFYNLNKRSLTLDLTRRRGAEIIRALARSADVIIESFAPGTIAKLGLGWDELHRDNPALILCSISPFGQTGPYRDFEADDTILTATGRDALRQRLPRPQAGAAAGLAGLSFGGHTTARSRSCARCWRAIATGSASGSISASRRRRGGGRACSGSLLHGRHESSRGAAHSIGAVFSGSANAATAT